MRSAYYRVHFAKVSAGYLKIDALTSAPHSKEHDAS